MHRLARTVVLLLAFAVLYAGPVAACVCASGQPAPSMPCCPDQPHHAGQPDFGMPPTLGASCGPAAVSLLPASSQDVQHAPVAIAAAAPEPWKTRGPPPAPTIQPRPAPDTAPIYLVTLRLRN